jgi:hypothetical protein
LRVSEPPITRAAIHTKSTARATWIACRIQSMPLVSPTPIQSASTPPSRAAAIPTPIVTHTEMLWRPGSSSRPSMPTIAPAMIAQRIVPIMVTSSTRG